MDGVLSTKDFMEEELAALMHEHKVWLFYSDFRNCLLVFRYISNFLSTAFEGQI